MPELPEVEVIRRELDALVRGRSVVGVERIREDMLRLGSGLVAEHLLGRRLGPMGRRGKHLLIGVEGELVLAVHLRMSGHVDVADAGEPLADHTHLRLLLDDGRELRYRDPRRFGRMWLLRRPQLERLPWMSALGPEPLEMGRAELAERLRGRHGSLKATLLDQRVVAGLGNIYVDELLFAAGLHPLLVAGRLREHELDELHARLGPLLREAIRAGGSSIRDYLSLTRRRGRFQERHRVFGRTGQPCPSCGTPILRSRVAGRGTHHCPRCQPRRRGRTRPSAGKGRTR